jgi:RHS repeat-associated protein
MSSSQSSRDSSGSLSLSANAQESSSFSISTPSINLPKGGGAIRGIGEKFSANPVTGTGSMTVPVATSPGRSGFGPQLSLSYDSGTGNGPFGFGWNFSLPTITRKTDKGLPQYYDAIDSDVFVLSGAEDLVPLLSKDAQGNWRQVTLDPRIVDGKTYQIRRYRPRIEGLFARIERWTNTADTNDVFWRSISKDNITTWYGKTEESRIVDPTTGNEFRTFCWLICESYDDKGNVMIYGYKRENSALVLQDCHEKNRDDNTRAAQRYLKYIRYGNRKPYFPKLEKNAAWPELLDDKDLDGSKAWMFEVVLDYGEHDEKSPTPNDHGLWPARPDPFSTYRAGFEVRTYRLCQRVLMFHHFPEESGIEKNCLVRSTDFIYSHNLNSKNIRKPIYTFLKKVTQTDYRRNDENGYHQKSLPPVEFEYSEPKIQDLVETVDPTSLENLPSGLDGNFYQWTDLHGEGIPGILTEQASGWYYKRNWSPIPEKNDIQEIVKAKFAPLEKVALKPNVTLGAGVEFMDLAGDGQPDVVVMDGPTPGLYEHDEAEGWQNFRPFTSRLNRNLSDPNLKFIDLDGDGHADILITEDEAFVWHTSLAEEGFGPAQRAVKALNEEHGPRIVFADGTQSIYLADLSGDGLTDIVRIRNGEVCYWPNLGYCRFGAKVTMDNSPWCDNPDQFNHKRIRLADIDGSGTTDIIYLHRDGVRLYFNQSGNSWSDPTTLNVFPRVDDLVSITPLDLLGNGTACLVWSSSLPHDAAQPMRYVNLMDKDKPHLLIKTINNLGAETRVHYAPSTKFYLQDKLAGKPWITKLPFPVHVVERVETWDHISHNHFVSRYAYHHGYFDGGEREFRGFGMVEQWDTEQFAALADGELPANNIAAESHIPPIHTKTWFHTGLQLGREQVSDYFAGLVDGSDRGEYYREQAWLNNDEEAKKRLLPDTILPSELTLEEEREACRALKGSMLRQEIYALDGVGADADYPDGHPYSVTEQNFTVEIVQRRGQNRHAVFFTHTREVITYHYERNADDPRIQHALTLEVDPYGNALQQVAIGYGRLIQAAEPAFTPADHIKQRLTHITSTENRFTNAITNEDDNYRTPLPAESRTYEMRKPKQEQSGASFVLHGFDAMRDYVKQAGDGAHDVDYEDAEFSKALQAATNDAEENSKYFRRLIEHLRTLYRPDDCGASQNNPLVLLPLKTLEPLALSGESYKLAFTPGLLTKIYQRNDQQLLPNPGAIIGGTGGDQGGYVELDGDSHWWIPSGRSFYHPDDVTAPVELNEARTHFFLPRRYQDPFDVSGYVDFDQHDLLMKETRDALDNRVTVVANDYRVLQPRLVSDPNGNQTEVAFDTLGMVVGTAVMSKPGEDLGDLLDGFVSDPEPIQLNGLLAKPRQPHPDNTQSKATLIAHTLLGKASTRILYDLDRFKNHGEPPFAITIARETHVSDLKPEQQSKLQISISYSDGFGREIQKKIQAEPGPLKKNGPIVNPRWVGSGWTIFNNKGKPVRQYEPFFDDTHAFKFAAIHGVSPILFYDPLGRVIATLHPNNTYEKVVFNPWQQTTWDVNDTCAPRNEQTGDPRTDPDISGYVAEYFAAMDANDTANWKTWYAQRIDGALGEQEKRAVGKAAAHADTPTTAHFDTLGRPFLTVARNRVICEGHLLDGKPDEDICTRVELDIEGNQREVWDERKLTDDDHLPLGDKEQRLVMCYAYDMLGNRIHQHSMEAGARWMLNDVAGKPIRAWDSRGHTFATHYDLLRRPLKQTVQGTGMGADPRTVKPDPLVIDEIQYGESLVVNPAADDLVKKLNFRTRIYRHRDSAGVTTNTLLDNNEPVEAYDFKGNLLHSSRQLCKDYKAIPDWSGAPELEETIFKSRTSYDALNRPKEVVAPDKSIYQPTFNEANLLDKIDVNLRGSRDNNNELIWTAFVTNIDYDAKGQRQLIAYANGASTIYEYDLLTFRLTHLQTTRPAGRNGLSVIFKQSTLVQDLFYTYDPAGNIALIEDSALNKVIHGQQEIEPACEYVYDALYRLIEAKGREHIGQNAFDFNGSQRDRPFAGLNANNNDLQALRNYAQRYVYDAVGNFLSFHHQHHQHINNNAGKWTRKYFYNENSLLDSTQKSNRLTRTEIGDGFNHTETYSYKNAADVDIHGCMTSISNKKMEWDYKDQLFQVELGGGGRAYYAYNASGERTRKIIHRQNGNRQEERIYVGGFEIYREFGADGQEIKLERETLHVMDDKQRIALVETKTVPDFSQIIRYQLGNHLGSASVELDGDAQLISYEEFHPYGTTSFQAMSGAEVSLKRYRYTGKERDEETGFSYHSARYYLPWLGRWSAIDPKGLSDGINVYSYVNNRPAIMHDPNGTDGESGIVKTSGIGSLNTPEWKVSVKKALDNDPYLKRRSEEERQFIQGVASRLLQARDSGLVALGGDKINPKSHQVENGVIAKHLTDLVAANNKEEPPKVMDIKAAMILNQMLDKAEERRKSASVTGVDFSIISLNRPTDAAGSPHYDGSAIDISRYAGKRIDFEHGDEAVDGVGQFYKDMQELDIRMSFGLPRNPKTDPKGMLMEYFDAKRPDKRKYYETTGVHDEKGRISEMRPSKLKPEFLREDFFFDRGADINNSPTNQVKSDIALFKSNVAKERFEKLYNEDRNGVLRYLFPDGWDHLHVQVKHNGHYL